MIAIGRLRFLNLLNCAQNWHKSLEVSRGTTGDVGKARAMHKTQGRLLLVSGDKKQPPLGQVHCRSLRKMSPKCLRRRENRDRGGFCDSPATEFWDLGTS